MDTDRILDFLEEAKPSIIKQLGETNDPFDMMDRLTDMLLTAFPSFSNCPDIAKTYLKQLFGDRAVILIHPTFNITTITNSPNTSVTTTAPPPASQKIPIKQTLRYQFIQDDSLTLKDRVVLSYLCKLDRLRSSGKCPSLSINRIRRFTGYRNGIVTHALSTLISLGYIDAKWKPLKTFAGKSFNRNGSDATLVQEIVKYNRDQGRTIYAGWAKKTFGISRPTFYRCMREHLRLKARTDETHSGNI